MQTAYNFDRPVVVTDVGGLAEVVPDDEAGFVRAVLDGQPEPPKYFAEMKRVN